MNSKKRLDGFSYRPTYKTLERLQPRRNEIGRFACESRNPIFRVLLRILVILKVRKFNEKQETSSNWIASKSKITNLLGLQTKKISLYQYYRKGVELWILDLETRTAKKISNDNLNANLGSPLFG